MTKPRVLWVTEASYLATGYGVQAKEILSRLHADGYPVAELACMDDPADAAREIPDWPYYSNHPESADEAHLYNADVSAQFGSLRFNSVCLDFLPTLICDARDAFMFDFQAHSPFRRHFRWLIQPTVDAEPQWESWLDLFASADGVMPLTDWGVDVLGREGGGTIPLMGSAPHGVDVDVFRPMDKAAVRRDLGVPEDAFVVGMVGRNQPRKLFPDLIEHFARFLAEADPETSRRSYLYLHTSHPDQGWDLPRHVKNSGIASRILFTYICRRCKAAWASLFADAETTCRECGGVACLPGHRFGVSRHQLAAIMNAFDLYVQYATNGGFEMPLAEAASCGVPVAAIDYSAMSDVVRKLGGIPLSPIMRWDSEMRHKRAVPDPREFLTLMDEFVHLGPEDRVGAGRLAREGVLEHYTWGRTVALWEAAIDEVASRPLKDPTAGWHSPPRATPAPRIPDSFPDNPSFVRWMIGNYLGRPDLLGSHLELRLVRDLNWGAAPKAFARSYPSEDSALGSRSNFERFGPVEATTIFRQMRGESDLWEKERISRLSSPTRT